MASQEQPPAATPPGAKDKALAVASASDPWAEFATVDPDHPMVFVSYPGCTGVPGVGGMNDMVALPRALRCSDHDKPSPYGKGPLCDFAGWTVEEHGIEAPPLRCPGKRLGEKGRDRACGKPLTPEGGIGRYMQASDFRLIAQSPFEAAWLSHLNYPRFQDKAFERSYVDLRGIQKDTVKGWMPWEQWLKEIVLEDYVRPGSSPPGTPGHVVAAGLGRTVPETIEKVATPAAVTMRG